MSNALGGRFHSAGPAREKQRFPNSVVYRSKARLLSAD